MAKPNKSPEELLAELVEEERTIEARKAKLTSDIRAAKLSSISAAVQKAGGDFDTIFKLYQSHKNSANQKQAQIAKIQADIQTDLAYVKDQYKNVRDTLVGLGVKEEYLPEFIGEAPAVKAAKVASAGAGAGKKRTKAKLPNGTVKSWTELLEEYKIPHTEGNSAHREWDAAVAANLNLPKIEVVE